MTRFHWQTLNLIKDAGRITYERLSETMRVFLDKDQLDSVVKDLTQRSWVRIEDSNLILTDAGRKDFTEIANTQDKVRKAVTKRISQEEYIMVTSILQRMIDKLRV